MSWRVVLFVKEVLLVAAGFVFVAPYALAGDKDHAAHNPITHSRPAPGRYPHAVAHAGGVSVAVTIPAQPAKKPLYVNLRGPDGRVRRFLVEGGRAAIQYRRVVLHPGESLTIRWTNGK